MHGGIIARQVTVYASEAPVGAGVHEIAILVLHYMTTCTECWGFGFCKQLRWSQQQKQCKQRQYSNCNGCNFKALAAQK